MSDVIFLDPSVQIPGDVQTITQLCKDVLLNKLICRIVDEDLCPVDTSNAVFDAKRGVWQTFPAPKIFTIDSTGVKTQLFTPADYDVQFLAGRVDLVTPTTSIVRASYTFFPFTDPQLTNFVLHSIDEISVLVYRPINKDNIPADYRPAICKRLYTNVLKALLLEAKDFFSVSVSGRSVNKAPIAGQINTIITQNETQLQAELNMLRHYNKTNRMLPSLESDNTIGSDAEIV